MTPTERAALLIAASEPIPARAESRAFDELGLRAGRFVQLVNALLDRPDAEAELPVEVHRLQRLRDRRREARRGVSTFTPL